MVAFGLPPEVVVANATARSGGAVGEFASNVLNVADTDALLLATLDQIAAAVLPGGTAILNLPAEPRKRAWTGTRQDEVRLGWLLLARFASVRRLPRIWLCRSPGVGGR